MQYSVFECDLNAAKLKEMKKIALQQIDKKEDNLRIYKICETCQKRIESFGVEKIVVL